MPHVYAIGDLHLSLSVPNKAMDVFGARWQNHAERIREAWQDTVRPEDLVLIPGDISWAMTLEEALPDLEAVGRLPGKKGSDPRKPRLLVGRDRKDPVRAAGGNVRPAAGRPGPGSGRRMRHTGMACSH